VFEIILIIHTKLKFKLSKKKQRVYYFVIKFDDGEYKIWNFTFQYKLYCFNCRSIDWFCSWRRVLHSRVQQNWIIRNCFVKNGSIYYFF